MSLFIRKHAIESHSASKSERKSRKRAKRGDSPTTRRICRVEELEKREYLAADPVSVGVVYQEQYMEELGDLFYVAWVGGENGAGTTLDTLVINLDKNGNGALDAGEPFFDTSQSGLGVNASVPFTVVDKSANINVEGWEVQDGGLTLEISFSNFYEGDRFVFAIDLDEMQSPLNPIVEGAEMGAVGGLEGSKVDATFSSKHYQTEVWSGIFFDNYDDECVRSTALSLQYSEDDLPYDRTDGNDGIARAGVYDDFTLTPKPIVISGTVYADHNVNCEYEPELDDQPLAGVEVTLVAEDGRTWTTTTDVNGYYVFNDNLMPGKYQIFSEANIVSPEGWQYFDFCASGGNYGERVNPLEIVVEGMQGGEHANENNFAKALVSTIDGYVFEDLNDANGKEPGEEWDGVRYPAEIQLWRIDYDANGDAVYTFMESQTVDADGYYKFELNGAWNEAGTKRKLPEKTYEIREIFASSDYADGKDYPGTLGGVALNDAITNVFVGYGQNGYHYDFGELKLGSIAGNVYEDRNDNGIKNVGESGIANVRIDLYKWDGSQGYVYQESAYTDANGDYLFDNLDINCDYAVKEWQPNDYDDGKDNAPGSLGGVSSDDYFSDVHVGWDQHGVNYNFGELKLGSIAGNVYEDRNDNGVKDPLEGGIANVQIDLYKWDGTDYTLYRSTFTDANGNYSFDKLPIEEQYAVRERQPNDYVNGKENAPGTLGGLVGNDVFEDVHVGWDDHGEEYNFGELKLGAITGYVYHDANDNGYREPSLGEAGIAGVTVELYVLEDGDYKKIAEQKTDEFGFYKFDNLDIQRTYAVKELQPEDWVDGKDREGTLGGVVAPEGDLIEAIPVDWADYGEEYDFGELLPPGSLSGFVYEDDNNDGIMDTNEAGIESVRVDLYRIGDDGTATFVDYRLTDANGYYFFGDLDPNKTYVLRERQPDAYYDGKDTVGTIFGFTVGTNPENDVLADVELPPNGHGVNYNFGELRPGAISGYVYHDKNDNGVRESGEPGIGGAAVTLLILNPETGAYEPTGKVATTDGNGHYVFENLEPARVYKLVETQPANYKDGKDAAGSLGGYVETSDVITAIPVKPADYGVEYDFGEIKEDEYIPPPPTIPPVTPPTNLWSPSPTTFPYIWYQPVIPGSMTTLYGGAVGFTEDEFTWKLSVLNGTEPRSAVAATSTYGWRASIVATDSPYHTVSALSDASNTPLAYNSGTWRLSGYVDTNGKPLSISFGLIGAKPVVGDFDGDGIDDIALYDGGKWYINTNRNSNSMYLEARLGALEDIPVIGDWDGDGKSDIGVFGKKWQYDDRAINLDPGLASDLNLSISLENNRREKNLPPKEKELADLYRNAYNYWREATDNSTNNKRYDLVDHVFGFNSRRGDVPIVGDWNGDGISEIGVYSKGVFYLDTNGNGVRDSGDTSFAAPEELRDFTAVVGDWTGEGIDRVGLFKDGKWALDVGGDGRFAKTSYHGQAGDIPVVGDWNGDGVDDLGTYTPHDMPVEMPTSSELAQQ